MFLLIDLSALLSVVAMVRQVKNVELRCSAKELLTAQRFAAFVFTLKTAEVVAASAHSLKAPEI